MKHLAATFLALVVTGLCAAAELPLVKVLSTGGTIASRYDPVQKGFVPALSGEQLLECRQPSRNVEMWTHGDSADALRETAARGLVACMG